MKNYIKSLILFSALFMGNVLFTNAQTVLWAKTGSSEGFENGNAIVADDSGNVYVTGQFEFTSVFDNYTLHSYGQHDIMVIKYGSDGNIRWIRQAGGKFGDIGNGIGIDAQHNVYVTGEFEDSATFSPTITKISKGGNDGFLAKYDANGNVLWVKGFGCQSGSDKGRALAVTPTGDVYVTGNYSSSTDFGSVTLNSAGSNDIFITKYNTNGSVVWTKSAGGSNQDRGYGLAIDASENVYVTGTFTQSATFKNTTITNPGNNSTFLAKYNSTGSFQWVKDAGACCDTTKSNSLSLDQNGNIYVTGYFMDHTKFGSYNFTSLGLSDIFIVKYSPTGSVLWAKQAGGIDEDGAYGIVVDTNYHLLYLTGLVRANGNFDSIPYTISGYKDAFIAAYDLNGNAQWVRLYGGHYRDAGAAITVDKSGYIYSTGLFNDIAQFGSITLNGYPNQPWADFYVDKLSPMPAAIPTDGASNLSIHHGNCSDLNLAFTPGNGSKRIIIARESSAVNSFPVNESSYNADAHFGNGSNLGNGNFVVYNGTGNNINITGLTAGATYYFSIIEYNGEGLTTNYFNAGQTNLDGTTAIFQITVTGLQNSICAGDSLNLLATGVTNCLWSPATGLSSDSGLSIIAMPLSNTYYTVTGNTQDGCSAQADFSIYVNPLPAVTFAGLGAICLNSSPINLNTGIPSGGIYSGAGVNGNQFDPGTAGSGSVTLSYQYTDGNGCSNSAQSQILVHSFPGVLISPISSLCDNANPVALTTGNPAGGIYSGLGVSFGFFNPAIGAGSHVITYTYTDANSCTGTSTTNVLVKLSPIVNLGNDLSVCAGDAIQLSAGSGFTSYSWSTGETIPAIIVDSAGTGLGTKTVSVSVSNSSGCFKSDAINVTFDLCAGINIPVSDFQNVSIYPNPFTNHFILTTDKTISYNIYDVCGALVGFGENVIGDVSAGEKLKAGIYFVEIISGGYRKSIKMMKSE